MRHKLSWMIGFAAFAALAMAQSWMSAYEDGLAKARRGEWAAARASFKQAIAYRAEDYPKATNLPGPATERRVWRSGAPYSPNFMAAYAGLRLAQTQSESSERTDLLNSVASELETLIAKKQYSPEAFYFLNLTYSMLNDSGRRIKLEEQFGQVSNQLSWKVDAEVVAPEEVAAIAQMTGRDVSEPVVTNPAGDPPRTVGNTSNPPMISSSGARVAVIPTKFALIIGNGESRLESLAVPFAGDDAQYVRESLMTNAGYGESNIDLVLNATKDQMLNSAKALADRLPDGATVLIFYSGPGANLDGKDYLAGVDTSSATDSSSMLAKGELYKLFMAKGARIFAFYQVHRPVNAGRYFGMEVPIVGSIAQMQATIPGDMVQSFVKAGKTRGLFVDAMAGAMAEFKSNRIPIQEFGWQVFNYIRKGDTGTQAGSSRQTPTLPYLTNMAKDARF